MCEFHFSFWFSILYFLPRSHRSVISCSYTSYWYWSSQPPSPYLEHGVITSTYSLLRVKWVNIYKEFRVSPGRWNALKISSTTSSSHQLLIKLQFLWGRRNLSFFLQSRRQTELTLIIFLLFKYLHISLLGDAITKYHILGGLNNSS